MRDLLASTILLAVLLACLGCDSNTSPVAPAGTILRIEANPGAISVTGSSTITVTALHSSGVPARTGTEILLTTSLGSLEGGTESRIRTDGNGIARATLRGDGRAGVATIRASSGTVGTGSDDVSVTVTIGTSTPQALKADFSATVSESLSVIFEDLSEGNPTGWEWDFGDGARSTEREPVHTYAEAASYVVSLRVRNTDGQDTFSKLITVPASEAEPPEASFTVEVSGLQATFTDTSEHKVTSWEWDFGDGARSAVKHPVHLYRRPGIYSVTLVVRNAAGASTFSKSVVVPQ
jgi:PKD repeat protein